MKKNSALRCAAVAMLLFMVLGMSNGFAQTVNVTVICNTSTCLDTLRPYHMVQLMGESAKGTTPAISWSTGPTLTNIGGDYWSTTIQAQVGDTIKFKFVAKFDADHPTLHWSGWEGPLNAGGDFASGSDRVLVVGGSDTTLPVQYYNGTDNKLDQYWRPFAVKAESVAIYFRVNMAGETAFDSLAHTVAVYGGAPLGSDSWPKIVDLTREANSRGGWFWSGTAYIPKSAVTAGTWQNYKFVYGGSNWETGDNRYFEFTNSIINVRGDTTLHWVYFSNKEPVSGEVTTVKVTFRCNTSTCLDTIQPHHIVGLNGESVKGIPGLVWDAANTIKLTNVGGDYWEKTIDVQPGDVVHYKFVTKYDDATMSKVNWGWEGDITNGYDNWTSRVLVVGTQDTVLPLQYYNGGTTRLPQYWRPFEEKQDTIAIYFRVNMGGVVFNPETQTVEVQGGAPLGTDNPWIKIINLTREVNSVNGGSFWSGVAYIAKANVTPGAQQQYKFVFRSPETWESIPNRSFVFSSNLINVSGDTTLHWNYFNNKAPAGALLNVNLLFRLKVDALEKVGLFNRTLGDRVGITGPKGWSADPFDFDTDPNMLKMTYNSDLEEWNLVEPFTVYPNDEIPYKYYIAWDSSRVDPASPNYIPGLMLSNGWEEPGVTGGADRKYTFTSDAEQIVPGDFGAAQQFFNSIDPKGAILTPVAVTFQVNMAPATNAATNPTNPLFVPGRDTVYVSYDGCFVPVTQGKTMYGTDNRLELTDTDGDGIYTGTDFLNAPTLNQLCYRITYTYMPEYTVTNGGGILFGRRYYQYIRPVAIDGSGNITWPSATTLPVVDWKANDLTVELPPDLNTPMAVKGMSGSVPVVYSLEQNYPNPFNPSTMITYSIPQRTHVRLEVFNILGQKVITLVDEEQEAGIHSVLWNTQSGGRQSMSSGVYFLKMHAGVFSSVKKMVLTK